MEIFIRVYELEQQNKNLRELLSDSIMCMCMCYCTTSEGRGQVININSERASYLHSSQILVKRYGGYSWPLFEGLCGW